jgi:tetratricopeptide (TPR) repeat protein
MIKPVAVFVSYAHDDERLRKALDRHLSLLKRDGTISVWHDRDIDAGDDWQSEISRHLEAAQLILALVSPSFLASDYCYEIEMQRALERHRVGEARVIPIVLRPVDWQRSPLGKLQALPARAKPVASWKDRDAAFADVAAGIRAAVAALAGRESTTDGPRGPRTETPAPKGLFHPPIWSVPHNRNPNFTGREEQLMRLRSSLLSGHDANRLQVLCGLAGVGKTQLALEYVYRNSSEYSVVWWIVADESATLPSEFAGLAEKLGLRVEPEPDQVRTIERVREWLDQSADWLLVFDDARDPRELQPYLPRSPAGHVLVTSRNPNWRSIGRPFPIRVPPREDSVRFVLNRTGQDDEGAAFQLSALVGDLPLALEQAAAYVEETGRTLQSYLELFRSHRTGLLERMKSNSAYSTSVSAVWDLSFKEVERNGPATAELITLAAFFAPDDIPIALFSNHDGALPDRLREVVQHPLALDEALRVLRSYSLVEISEHGVSIHALVQAFARDRLSASEQRSWARTAALLVYELFLFERDSVDAWRRAEALLPHVLAAAAHAEALRVTPEVTARLRDQAGLDLRRGVELARATELFERALAADEETYGANHPRVATTLGNLAAALEAAGELRGAQESYERALAIDERAYGPDDPTVAGDASKLASVLQARGEFASARVQFERALAIDEKTLGTGHPLVAVDVAALAELLKLEGDLPGAENCYAQALAIERAVYGEDHPRIAARLADLASVRHISRDLDGARALYEDSLAITERVYRPDNEAIGSRALELGKVLLAQDDLRGACAQYAKAARVFRDALGEHHPQTVTVQRTLDALVVQQGPEQPDSPLRLE